MTKPDYVPGIDPPKAHIASPDDVYALAKKVAASLNIVHKHYAPVYAESYSPVTVDVGDQSIMVGDPVHTVLDGGKIKMKYALVEAYQALRTSLAALTGAQTAMMGVWHETENVLCRHCSESVAGYGMDGLCSADYAWARRHNGELPSDAQIAQRHSWKAAA